MPAKLFHLAKPQRTEASIGDDNGGHCIGHNPLEVFEETLLRLRQTGAGPETPAPE